MDIKVQFAELIPALALGSLLVSALLSDLLTHRIPNTVCLLLALSGIACQTAVSGTDGTLMSIAGVAVGLLMLLPFYVTGGMAAGDVKLLASSASYLGPLAAITAGLGTLIVGGAVALLLIVFRIVGNLIRTSRQAGTLSPEGLSTTILSTAAEARDVRGLRFPYAFAIAAGVFMGALHHDSLIAHLLLNGGIR